MSLEEVCDYRTLFEFRAIHFPWLETKGNVGNNQPNLLEQVTAIGKVSKSWLEPY